MKKTEMEIKIGMLDELFGAGHTEDDVIHYQDCDYLTHNVVRDIHGNDVECYWYLDGDGYELAVDMDGNLVEIDESRFS